MKKVIFLIVISIVIIASVITFVMIKNTNKEDIKILEISDIESDPSAFIGEITITGITSIFSEVDLTVFGIMDTTELLFCKNFYCGAYTQLVRNLSGEPLPELADEVNITGSFIKHKDYYIFEATKIEVKRNLIKQIVE